MADLRAGGGWPDSLSQDRTDDPFQHGGQPGPRKQRKRQFRPAFRLYDLRDTCATLLLLAGESPKVVSERLGHASITLTLDTYSHVLPTMQEAAVAKLDAMFGMGTV